MPQKPTTRNAIRAQLEINGPMTCKDLAQATGLSFVAVTSSIREWHTKGGEVYIHAWLAAERGGKFVRVYGLGGRADAPQPKKVKLPRKEVAKRYYWRHRALVLSRQHAARGSKLTDNPFSQLIDMAGASNSAAKVKL